MSDYTESIRACAYRSPSGATFTLQFDDIERSGGKKVAIHELPQQDKAEVQDNGNQAEKYPMKVYFTGNSYQQSADSFWRALSERYTKQQPGALQHPRWGDVSVIPLTFSQTEKLVEGLGISEFSVDFIRVWDQAVFPVTTVSTATAIASMVSDIMDEAAIEAGDLFFTINASDLLKVKLDILAFLDAFTSAFADILAVSDAILAEANAIISEIENTIDELVSAPLELFNSVKALVNLPAQIVTESILKVDAFVKMIETQIALIPETFGQAVAAIETVFNIFGATAVASTIGDIDSRSDAVSIADKLDDLTETLREYIESSEAAVEGFLANRETLLVLESAMSTARATAIERSFSLKLERRLTLMSDRTPLDLIAEFHGDVIVDIDAVLDQFILDNALEDSEIIVVPAGREVVYYG